MRLLPLLFAVFFLLFPQTASTTTSVDVGLSAGPHGLNSFYLAVGEYYRVPRHEVIYVRDKGIPTNDIPVVFFLAKTAHVAPSKVMSLRLRGFSWLDITYHYGLSPAIYYVPVKEVHGPPYGKAYGYYKKKPKHKWKEIDLSDEDVMNLVNLRFMSSHYNYEPERIVKLRSQGRDFVVINDDVRKVRKIKDDKVASPGQGEGKNGKEKHKEKGKDKEKGKGKKQDD
jgi:hypothetical protein